MTKRLAGISSTRPDGPKLQRIASLQAYGADIALRVAVEHPELVRSLFLNEPPLPSILTNPDDQKVVNDEGKEFAPVVAAAKAGNAAEAARLMIDYVHADPGNFERRSQA